MAYRAEIEIGVKGAKQLKDFRASLENTNKVLRKVNEQNDVFGKPLQSLKIYRDNLKLAAESLENVKAGIKGEKDAVRDYLRAASELNAFKERQNRLLDEEANKLGLVTQKLKEYNAAAAPSRQVGSMAGAYLRPNESRLRGQTSAINPQAQIKAAADEEVRQELRIRAANDETIRVLRRRVEIEEKIADVRSKRIAAERSAFLLGSSGTQLQGPLAGPGSLGFPVALPGLSEAESRGLQIAKQKLDIINRTVQRRKELLGSVEKLNAVTRRGITDEERKNGQIRQRFGLRGALQALESKSLVAAKQANREADELNEEKRKQLELEKLINSEQVRQSISRRKRIVESAKETRRRRKEAIGSGIIGGAFPLLFGQGAGAAGGGALGGIAGGLIGGQFGFALSLVGTAAGTSADELREAASTIAAALDGTSASLEAVKEAGISVKDSTIDYVKELENSGRALDAYAVVQNELNNVYGTEGVRVLQELKEANDFANAEAGKLSAVLQTELAPVFILLAQLSGGVARGLSDFIPGLIDLISDVTLGIPGPTTFNKSIRQTPRSDPAKVAAGVRERDAELAADAEVRGIVAATEAIRRQVQLSELNNDLTDKRVVSLKRSGIEIKANNEIQALSQEILDDIFNINLKNTNEAKIQKIEQQKILDLANLDNEVRRAINSETEKTTRELKKQATEQRKITDAQISAKLAEDILLAQPLVDATPFSRTTPEQEKSTKLTLQDLKFTAEKAKILNQNLSKLQEEAALKQAGANNDLAVLNINKAYTETIKQRQENYLTQTGQLQSQLDIISATTREEAERVRLEQELQTLKNTNNFTEPQLQQLRTLKEALIEAEQPLNKFITDSTKSLNDLEQVAVTVSQGIGNAFGEAMTTGLSEVVAGTKSAEEVFADFLRNIAKLLLQTAAQMIATYIAIGVARMFAGVPASGSGSSDSFAGVPNSILDSVLGARANGGPVASGNPYIVGERGPELFVPRSNGRVVPNGRFGGGGGGDTNVVVNVDAKGSSTQGNEPNAKALGAAIGAAVQSEIIKQKRPGGLLA